MTTPTADAPGAATLPRLMLITDDGLADPVAPLARAIAAAPGQVLVQLRLKGRSADAQHDALRRLRDLGAPVVLNTDGVRADTEGFHQTGAAALARPGPGLWGRSCHDARELRAASAAGCDYAVLSPVGVVPGKGAPLGVGGFAGALPDAGAMPVFGLGGVGPDEARALRDVGAHGVAVIRAVSRASDPAEAARRLLAALGD